MDAEKKAAVERDAIKGSDVDTAAVEEAPEDEVVIREASADGIPAEEAPVISLKHVAKEYRFFKTNHQRMRYELFGGDAGDRIPVLKDVSLDIYRGEKIAVIGNFGSGRTTLMKLMAGILLPDKGVVAVRGNITAVFDNKLGFETGLSGRDNIKLRGSIMGWSPEQIAQNEPAIAGFADITDRLDEQMRSYKSGTPARIGFAMATHYKPEIMIYDDVFAFGGSTENAMCLDRFKEVTGDDQTTLVMIATNIPVVRNLCSKGIVVDEGEIKFEGPFGEALKFFRTNCKADPMLAAAAKKRLIASEKDSDDLPQEEDY